MREHGPSLRAVDLPQQPGIAGRPAIVRGRPDEEAREDAGLARLVVPQEDVLRHDGFGALDRRDRRPPHAAETKGQRMGDPAVNLIQRVEGPEDQRRRPQALLAKLARKPRPDVADSRFEVLVHGGGNVSFTSAIDMDGMSLMNARNSRKKKPKAPMVIDESMTMGRKMPHVYG